MNISPKVYDMVIFDVDGTLLDTSEGLLSSALYTLKEHDLPLLSPDKLKTFIGPPIQVSFLRYFPNSGAEKAQALADTFRKHYSEDDLFKATPYPGILSLVKAVKKAGIKPAVATYKRQDYAEAIVRHFGFGAFTDIIYGADNENRLKKKDIIQMCLKASGVSPERVLMIGDTDNDAIGAGELGMDFLGVTYGFGFHTPEEAKALGAIATADSVPAIAEFLGLHLVEGENAQ